LHDAHELAEQPQQLELFLVDDPDSFLINTLDNALFVFTLLHEKQFIASSACS